MDKSQTKELFFSPAYGRQQSISYRLSPMGAYYDGGALTLQYSNSIVHVALLFVNIDLTI